MKHGSDVRLNDFSHSLSSIQWIYLMFSLSLPSSPHPPFAPSLFSFPMLFWTGTFLPLSTSHLALVLFSFFQSISLYCTHCMIFLSLSVYQCLCLESQFSSCPDRPILLHLPCSHSHCSLRSFSSLLCWHCRHLHTVICSVWALQFYFPSSFILLCTVN